MTRHDKLVARGCEIVQAAPQLYCFGDFEGQGPAGIGAAVSFGVIDSYDSTFERELRPTDKPGTRGSRQFCEEHGLSHERLLREGMPPQQAMRELSEWVRQRLADSGKQKAVFVGFPSWYDFAHCDTWAHEAGFPNPFGLNGLCTQSMAFVLTLMSGSPHDWDGVSREQLPAELLPPQEFTHNALKDAIYQQQLHYALIGLLDERLNDK